MSRTFIVYNFFGICQGFPGGHSVSEFLPVGLLHFRLRIIRDIEFHTNRHFALFRHSHLIDSEVALGVWHSGFSDFFTRAKAEKFPVSGYDSKFKIANIACRRAIQNQRKIN
jgi:hypothetical protein